jgi:uncharacterized phiE125 gp8 family phage protein
MNYNVTTEPKQEPINLDEAKEHLRVTTDDDDCYIDGLILTARGWAEKYQGRSYITQTITMKLDSFPLIIQCPAPPLQSVTSITYVDTAGDTQTLDSSKYVVDTAGTPGRIYEAYNTTWPATRDQLNAVTVTYIAGYGDTYEDVPMKIRQGMKILIGQWYEFRAPVACQFNPTEIPMTAKTLLGMDRLNLI